MMPKTGRACLSSWIAATLLLGSLAYAIAEELILTTYYPSPRGVYQELRVSGNLGVGTMMPDGKLDVRNEAGNVAFNLIHGWNGNPTSTEASTINLGYPSELGRTHITGYMDRLSIAAGGQAEALHVVDNNVGIGTTSPSRKLQVFSDQGVLALFNGPEGTNRIVVGSAEATAKGLAVGYTNTGDFGWISVLGDGAGASLVIRTGGNVGIGTLAGPTGAYVCVDAGGTLYRNAGGCP